MRSVMWYSPYLANGVITAALFDSCLTRLAFGQPGRLISAHPSFLPHRPAPEPSHPFCCYFSPWLLFHRDTRGANLPFTAASTALHWPTFRGFSYNNWKGYCSIKNKQGNLIQETEQWLYLQKPSPQTIFFFSMRVTRTPTAVDVVWLIHDRWHGSIFKSQADILSI